MAFQTHSFTSVHSSSEPTPESLNDLLRGIPVVDADTHITEWYDLWTSRATPAFKDRVPQAREVDGRTNWFIDGKSIGSFGASSAIRKDGAKLLGFSFRHLELPDVHPASYDVRERVKFMDTQRIAAQIAYPNLLGFGGQKAMLTDEAVRNVSVTIFNDAMAEMQADSGNRIYPMAMMPWWDIKLAAQEAERCADMGLRGINMNPDPHSHGLPHLGDPAWDELWSVCIDKSLPVNFHVGASDDSMSWFSDGLWPGHHANIKLAYGSLMLFVGNMRVLANFMFSRTLERLPALKIVSVEGGAGWVPFFLEAIEYQMNEAGMEFSESPADMFKRQIYTCSWLERKNIVQTARQIGVDNLLFETDFPHPTCLYPDGWEYLRNALSGFTYEERKKVFSDNAISVYNLDLSNAAHLTCPAMAI